MRPGEGGGVSRPIHAAAGIDWSGPAFPQPSAAGAPGFDLPPGDSPPHPEASREPQCTTSREWQAAARPFLEFGLPSRRCHRYTFARKMKPMRTIIATLLFTAQAALGAEPGAFVEQPNIVGKITEALVASKADHLTPHSTRDGDKLFSYHLKSVSYLGTIERGSEKFILATALFLRSSAQGSEYPPARGHGFLLCLSPDFRLVSHCRLDFPDVELVGMELRRQQEKIGDFSASDIARTRGFLIDGDDVLPYPFSDRLADPHEEKRSGEQDGGGQPATRPESK